MQAAAERVGAYNIIGVNWWMEEAILLFCWQFEGFCEEQLALAADADPSVDNMERFDVFMSNYPAGGTYQDMVLLA